MSDTYSKRAPKMFNFYIKNDNFWKILKIKPDQNTHQIAPFKIFFQGAYPQTPLAKRMAAMHSMSLCDVQISKSEKKIIAPPRKSWLQPWP